LHLGLCFFTPEDDRADVVRHLWFVLSDPTKSGRVIIGNVSTKPCPSQQACAIGQGEHEAVSEDSHLRVDKLRVPSVKDLATLLANGSLQQTSDATPALVLRLQRAIL
jgi:hypothetical protein